MKRLALILPLLTLAGCAVVQIRGANWQATACTVFKDPKLDNLTVVVKGPTTTEVIRLGDYSSVTKITGAELGSLIATVAKVLLAIP